jgi:hypothetical protein
MWASDTALVALVFGSLLAVAAFWLLLWFRSQRR